MSTRARVRALVRSAYVRPLVGLFLGPALAAALLAADGAGGASLPVGNARPLLGSVIAGSISMVAFVFWVRGLFVQLASGDLPARVVRLFLDDAFLQWAIGLVLATFGYATVVLLSLPPEPAAEAPVVAVVGGAVLTAIALMAVVATIVDSATSTDEAQVLTLLTHDAITALRRRFPAEEEQQRVPAPIVRADQHETVTVLAPATGWVNDVDERRLLAAVPAGHHLQVRVSSGAFVAERGVLGCLSGPSAARADLDPVRRAFVIEARRRPDGDANLAVGRLVDVALDELGGSARTAGHEALMHLGLVLKEAFRRDLSDGYVTGDDTRTVGWCVGASHADVLADVVEPLHEQGAVTASVAETLLRALGVAARGLPQDDARTDLLRAEARRVLAAVGHDGDHHGGRTDDPHRVAVEEGLVDPADVASSR